MLIIKTGMKHACEACVVLYLAQGSYNIGTLDLACLHYIVTTHATSASFLSSGFITAILVNPPEMKQAKLRK